MARGGVGLAGFWVAREELGLVLPLLNVNDVYMSYLLICLKKTEAVSKWRKIYYIVVYVS